MHQIKSRIARAAASLIVAGATLLGANAVQAQEKFPDRPIRLIVPFSPGGQTDIVCRHLGARITSILGQQMVIDNRAGAAHQDTGTQALKHGLYNCGLSSSGC